MIWRPRRLNISIPPVAGAALLYLIGLLDLRSIISVWEVVWNATFTLIAIIFLSLLLDEIGFFRFIAIKVASLSKGRPARLLILIIFLSSLITAIFSNDGSVLVMTPIVYSILKESKADRSLYIPFLVTTGFVCDITSVPFSISNLVNIISTGYFHIPFINFARVMILPDLAAVFAAALLFYIMYRKDLYHGIDLTLLPKPESVLKDKPIFYISIAVVSGLIVSYAIAGFFLFPISLIAMPVVACLFVVIRSRVEISPRKLFSQTPWEIIFFALGMFLVVYAMSIQGLGQLLINALTEIAGLSDPLNIVATGFLFSGLASIMNNLPSVILGNLAISAMQSKQLFYVNVLANDLGTKFTPIGSLATLLWMDIIRRKSGLNLSYRSFLKAGVIITPPLLIITLLVLWGVLML